MLFPRITATWHSFLSCCWTFTAYVIITFPVFPESCHIPPQLWLDIRDICNFGILFTSVNDACLKHQTSHFKWGQRHTLLDQPIASLAPLSWFFVEQSVRTAHAHQCCRFQSYAKTVPSRMKLTSVWRCVNQHSCYGSMKTVTTVVKKMFPRLHKNLSKVFITFVDQHLLQKWAKFFLEQS